MIIEVERFYKASGVISNIMVNTNYIRTIEGVVLDQEDSQANCRIVMEGNSEDPQIFYVTDTYSSLRRRIMGRKK